VLNLGVAARSELKVFLLSNPLFTALLLLPLHSAQCTPYSDENRLRLAALEQAEQEVKSAFVHSCVRAYVRASERFTR